MQRQQGRPYVPPQARLQVRAVDEASENYGWRGTTVSTTCFYLKQRPTAVHHQTKSVGTVTLVYSYFNVPMSRDHAHTMNDFCSCSGCTTSRQTINKVHCRPSNTAACTTSDTDLCSGHSSCKYRPQQWSTPLTQRSTVKLLASSYQGCRLPDPCTPANQPRRRNV